MIAKSTLPPTSPLTQDQSAALAWLRQIGGRKPDASAKTPASTPAPAAVQISADSRRITPGDIFFAFPGDDADGRRYIADAIERGAAAVLFDDIDFSWDDGIDLPHRGLSNLKPQSGPIANAYYDEPDQDMFTVAVTGTNGKTSCAYWLAGALSQLQPKAATPAAVIGTLGVGTFVNGVPNRFETTGYTTPDAVLFQRKLAELRTLHVAAVALEASSIGLAQGRISGLHIDVALFTNLTRDHLDFHHTMAAYGEAKAILFDRPELQHGVVNLDDAFGVHLAQRLQKRGVPVIGYSLKDAAVAGSAEAAAVDGVPVLRASAIRMGNIGATFQIDSPFGSGTVKSHLIGEFNVSNLLGVLGVLLAKGTPWNAAITAISALRPAPGRMQQLGGQDAPLVIIDYAHTPDAMEKTLTSLREMAEQRHGKLWCVFGCGGDRDTGKRPEMGRASELADEVVLTSDNPRSEAPLAIIEQTQRGMQKLTPHILEDRATAILWSVRHAGKQDVVLLAGKGHEMYQEINGKKQPFLDADHAALALAARATMLGGRLMHATLAELMTWIPGAVLHGATADAGASTAITVDAVVTDSRAVTVGCLFVALRGERFDAHDFLDAVQNQRAAALLIERIPTGLTLQIPAIVVPDTRLALAAIAQHWRAKYTLPVIAVTGSNGKTTVKEMIASILEAAFGTEAQMATRGNFNNEIGVPLTLFRLNPAHRAAVVELGMNHPGEIAVLAAMAQPTIALVNNAQREHQEFMVSVEAVAQENGAAIRALPADGVAVFPAADTYAPLWRKDAGARRVVSFGLAGSNADVLATYDADTFGSRMAVKVSGASTSDGKAQSFTVRLNAAGEHNVLNALAAIACTLAAGVDVAAIVRGLEAFSPVAGRLQRKQAHSGALLIDDTYNANPDSVRAAIDVLAQAAAPRVLILGDMGEVGDQGLQFHEEIGRYARQRQIEHVLTLGELAWHVTAAFNASAVTDRELAEHYPDIEDLKAAAAALATPDATVLIKGSRFMKMERVVQHLAKTQSAAKEESV